MLIAAHRVENALHVPADAWLRGALEGDAAYGMSDLVLSGFLRIVTKARALDPPTPLTAAMAFVRDVREPSHCVNVRPRARHGQLFIDLVESTGARGNRVPDAYFAALAIESRCEWITFDRGFARYSGLKWRSPLDPA